MSTTPRLALPYPELIDNADVPFWNQALAEALDSAAIYDQSTLANRPASTPGSPGIIGRFYYATDEGLLYLDLGTSWVPVQTAASSINRTGLLSARPAAGTMAAGTRYFATDQVAEYIGDGVAWTRISDPAGVTASWYKPDAAAPTGWVKYDGSNLPASAGIYADLYAHLGNTVTTPDTRGRTEVGLGTHADVDTIGENEGLSAGARRPKHKHTVVQPTITVTDPTHGHNITVKGAGGAATTNVQGNDTPGVDATLGGKVLATSTGISAAASGGTAGPQTGNEPTDTPAYIVALKIAKL